MIDAASDAVHAIIAQFSKSGLAVGEAGAINSTMGS
jgi:hypothetical protein